jgi:hypothetical protein
MNWARAAVILIFCLLSTPAASFDNEPDGFRDIKWGTNIKNLAGMEKRGGDSIGLSTYTKKGDDLKIGEADIGEITYAFYKNRFYSVVLDYKGLVNFENLKNIFFDYFGAGYKSNKSKYDYFWHGNTVRMLLTYNELNKDGTVTIVYVPIWNQQDDDKKERGENSVKDFEALPGRVYIWKDKKGGTHISDQPPIEDADNKNAARYKNKDLRADTNNGKLSDKTNFQNEPDSFRGIKWGTDAKDLPNFKKINEEPSGMSLYQRKNEKLKIGEADIESIIYGFYKGKFLTVFIHYSGYSNFVILESTLYQLYGDGKKDNQSLEHYRWPGNTVSIDLDYDKITNKGKIHYMYIPISKQQIKDRNERAKEGAKDL